tara:strand:- start:35 stop:3190 length:3156 start_codon:yes stop_codon:yes gene_type:complete
MTTASKQTQAQKLTPELTVTTSKTGTDKKILQELEQIGNNPDSAAAREDAWPKIDALRANYGAAVVDPIIADIYGTNAYGVDSIMSKYATSNMASEALAAATTNKATLAEVLLHKEDILEDNDSVVKDGEKNDQTAPLAGEAFINLTSQTHQCILQHYLKDVAEYHRSRLHLAKRSRRDDNFLDQILAPVDVDDKAKIILVDDSDPDSSVAPINALTSLGKTSGLSTLLPADLAKAMPKLRLYKIYRKNGKESGKVEFKFPTATDSGFLTDVASDIDIDGQAFTVGNDFTMTPGYAKGRAAGIKSFDWSFVGGDPFTATRDLTAKLTIFFQDFRDLTLVRQGANLLDKDRKLEPYKYLDLIVQPDCRGESFTANSTTSAARKTANKEMVFNPDCYEVSVEVGYASSTDLPLALKDRNDTLYLTMVEHSFDIGQDGTFSLSIDYRARLATLLGDKGMNVLSPGGGHMIKDDVYNTGLVFDIREIERQLEEEESKESPNKLELDAIKATKKHLLYVRNNGLYRSITATLLEKNLTYKLDFDREIFTKFSQFNKYNSEGDKNKLVGIDDVPALKPGSITVIEGIFEGSAASLETDIANLEDDDDNVKNSEGRGSTPVVYRPKLRDELYFTTVGNIIAVALAHITGENAFSLGTQGDIEVIKNIHKAALKDYDESIATSAAKKEKAAEAAAPVTAGAGVSLPDSADDPENEGKSKLDLSNKEFQMNNKKYKSESANLTASVNETQRILLERFRVILGSVSYEEAKTGEMKSINIAHLPVSMQMFRQFMIDKVIGTQRAFYSFQDFVRDILTDIVFDSLQRICFGGVTKNTKIRTGISLFNGQGAKPAGTKEPITSLDKDELYGYRRPKSEKAHYKSLSPAASNAKNPIFTNIISESALDFNYLMFTAFSVASLNKNLHGNEVDDNDNGIAHFRYGSTTGMMKSVNFSKTPLEYAAEERYVREGSDNLLNQLAGRYEMQMSLVGNNMFIPGQYVYFDPVALGIGKSMTNDGSSRSLANLMGLGGYHIITEVGCSIAPGKFETTIKALWETGGTPKP